MPQKFILDAMLGKLARWLRIMGHDAYYRPYYKPGEIRSRVNEGRVFITRNLRCSECRKEAVFLSPDQVGEQLKQMHREGYILVDRTIWFTRCMICNEPLLQAPYESLRENVPDYVYFKNPYGISYCPSCNRFFWPGTHRQNMMARLLKWGF